MHLDRSKKFVARVLIAASLVAVSGGALAQIGTAITYQGVLERNGIKVNTPTDMRFTLYDAAVGGSAMGNQVTLGAQEVANGLFAAELNFGVDPYTTDRALWLQIEVKNPAGPGVFVPMATRQRLTPSPFSLRTRGVNVGDAGNVATGGPLFPNADFTINGNGDNANLFLKATSQGFGWNLGTDGPGLFFNTSNGQGSSVNMVTMKDNGNVGIGTDVPAQRLDVRGQLQVADSIRLDQSNLLKPMLVRQDNPFTSGTKTGFGRWGMYKELQSLFLGVPSANGSFATSISFGGWDADSTRRDWMTIANSGKVGIGAPSPEMSLEVSAPSYYGGATIGVSQGDQYAYLLTDTQFPPAMIWPNSTGFRFVTESVRGSNVDREIMRLAPSGNVGIGTTTPSERLDVNGNVRISTPNRFYFGAEAENTDPIYFERSNYGVNQSALFLILGDEPSSSDEQFQIRTRNIGGGGDSVRYAFQPNGDALKVGEPVWRMFSDARLKHDIQPLEHSLDRVLQLHGKTFYYNDPNALGAAPGLRTGFVAQEVEMVFPNWVGEKDGYKTLAISGFEALTVESLRELRAEKDAQIAELKAQNADLAARLERLESLLGQSVGK